VPTLLEAGPEVFLLLLSLLMGFEHLVWVLGWMELCINVRNMDVAYAVSPASPKSLYQDIASVFCAIVLNEGLASWA
jgi:hypothetical protein